MRRHLRRVPGGGIAWERRVFTHSKAIEANDLIDAAVDIAWARLMPRALERPLIDVSSEGSKIVFRVITYTGSDIERIVKTPWKMEPTGSRVAA